MGNLFVKQKKELTEEEKKKEEARKEELRNKRKEKQAQYDNYAKEQQDREQNDIVAKAAVSKEAEPKAEQKVAEPAKNYVENSTEAVAKAKAGDYIKRNDGTEVQLTQADIDAAQPKVIEKPEPEVDTTTVAKEEPKTDVNTIPESIDKDLEASDEGQYARKVVEDGDLFQLTNITDPEGNSVLKGTYDENGYYVPHIYKSGDPEVGGMSKGLAGALTIVSKALQAAGALAGIPIPPINFYDLFGQAELADKMNEVEKNFADLVNEPIKSGKTQEAESLGAATGRQEAFENQAQSAIENPELYEKGNEVARAQAAVSGQNTAMDVAKQEQEWQSKEKELDREFAKVMNDMNTESQIAILKQQAINQKELATLMNDLDVQRVFKKIAYGEQYGKTPDDIAKWIRAEQGTTKLMAGLKMGTDVTNAAANIVSTFMNGKSDKNVKKYVASNSKMLMNAWKRK